MEVVAGSTGYVGSLVVDRLARERRPVRALARDPSELVGRAGVDAMRSDLLEPGSLMGALEGCSTAYYLVHSMEAPGDDSDFASRDRRAAESFARAAGAAGVRRIVYLGGIMPADGPSSPHLASRLEVERMLLEAAPEATALRASILIGARSSSFRILVRLVERLRVLPLPSWRDNRTQPIDERDAVEYLIRTPSVAEAAGRSLDIAGPDVLSYGEMIERIAEAMGIGRAGLRLRASQTRGASAMVSALTDQPVDLVRPLMESLEHDLLPRDDDARELYGLRPRRFERAVERALREWESREPLAAR
jgi:uncharacterized protein YbjT (DUF2867 family)